MAGFYLKKIKLTNVLPKANNFLMRFQTIVSHISINFELIRLDFTISISPVIKFRALFL